MLEFSSGMNKISSFFNNLPSRKRPSTVFRLNQAYSQTLTDCRLMEGKLFVRVFSPSSISSNDNTIRHKKFRSSKLFKEPCSTCSQTYHSDHSITEPIN